MRVSCSVDAPLYVGTTIVIAGSDTESSHHSTSEGPNMGTAVNHESSVPDDRRENCMISKNLYMHESIAPHLAMPKMLASPCYIVFNELPTASGYVSQAVAPVKPIATKHF